MPAQTDPNALRDALRAIRTLKSRIAAFESAAPIEIAIVGTSARFPGASTITEFGEMLADGRDSISEPPANRRALWASARGGAAIEPGLPIIGGYVDWPLDQFDNDYFRISPRESRSMDPQQRLTLELSVEALENAGIPLQTLRGSLTGVYYGFNNEDFGEIAFKTGRRSGVDPYSYTGNTFSVAAGRVSYALDLRGPNVAIDTACSSSLVAIQLACKALAARECELALAGGVNLILSDAATTGLHRLRALSPDGRCWSFDTRANGFARAEGGAAIVLKRLDDALAAGDTVHAVLLGGAVHHGGAASGLTAPNGAAQAAVIRAALRSAQVAPERVDYVEAHMTGTALGDPIELGAVADVFGGERERPLLLTSVKSNVGHLEAAAGICGLLRVVAALSRSEVAPQANLGTLNPALDLADVPADVPRERRAWPRPAGGRRVAGVSSFGISGTIAHLIVADPPLAPASSPKTSATPPVFVLSGKTAGALRDAAAKAVAYLTQADLAESDHDIAFTACARRDHHAHRLAVVGGDRTEWVAALRRFLEGDASRLVLGEIATSPHRVAYIFDDLAPDAGERELRLFEASAEAKGLFDACVDASRSRFGLDLRSSDAAASRDEGGKLALDVLHFVLEVSLFREWERTGLAPDVLVGVGLGEIAAAHAAGAIALEDALRLLVARRRAENASTVLAALEPLATPLHGLLSPTGKPFAFDAATVRRLLSTRVVDDDVVDCFRELGFATLVAISPAGTMSADGKGVLATIDPSGRKRLLASLVEAHCAGAKVAWARYYVDRGKVVALPTYPWRRVRVEMIGAEPAASDRPRLLVLSGRDDEALRAAVADYRARISGASEEEDVARLCRDAATNGALFAHRAAIVASDRAHLVGALDALTSGKVPPGAVRDVAQPGKLAWLFPGQGSQTLGMGRGLYAAWPVFRSALDEAWAALDPHLPKKLRDVMWADPESADAPLLHQTQYTQPALFALEVALSALWRAWGVNPDFVAGHSVGEVTAAYVAGVFSLEDAARLVTARARLMQALPAGGAMIAIGTSEAEVGEAIASHSGVSIAAINGPDAVVISGAEAAVTSVAEAFVRRGIRMKRLEVSHAFHSPLMAPMLDAFRRVAEAIDYRPPRIPLVGNLTGARVTDEPTSADYWVKHVREAVRFGAGIVAMHASGVRRFLEMGPQGTLVGLVHACLTDAEHDGVRLVRSLARDRAEPASVLEALGRVYCHGAPVDWSSVFPHGSDHGEVAVRRIVDATGHPLLGGRLPLAGSTIVYESVITPAGHAWLYEYRLAQSPVVSAAGLAELARAAGSNHFDGGAVEVSELTFHAPVVLPRHGGQRVQVLLQPEGEGSRVSIHSQAAREEAVDAWTLHATGRVRRVSDVGTASVDWASAEQRCVQPVDIEKLAEAASAAGLGLGPTFRGLRRLLRAEVEAVGAVALPKETHDADRYGIHPALLDAAFRIGTSLDDDASRVVPLAIERFTVFRPGAAAARVQVRFASNASASRPAAHDLVIGDEQGRIIAEVTGLRLGRIDAATVAGPEASDVARHLYRVEWVESRTAASPAETSSESWLVVGRDDDPLADALSLQLEAGGLRSRRVDSSRLAEALPADRVVCVWSVLPAETSGDAALQLARQGLEVVNRLAMESKPPRLSWVTKGGVHATPGDRVEPALFALWGLGRSAMQEHPELGIVLLDAGEDVKALARELRSDATEPQIALRGGSRRVARLVRAGAASPDPLRELRTDGTVLVTGGLGELGLLIAKSLAKRGVRRLLLTGRRGDETPGAKAAVRELEALGAIVTVAAVDVADRSALSRVVSAIPAEMPLRGVVHAAGVLDDGMLSEQTPERFTRVMAPKVLGASHLDSLTRALDLDMFVLFSSASGTFGNAGQGSYAAANTFLDGVAALRRQLGLPAQSLAWGLWMSDSDGGAGLAASLSEAQRARLAASGFGALRPSEGVALFDAAARRSDAHLVPVTVDVEGLRRRFADDVPPLWRALIQATRPETKEASGAWGRELASLDAASRADAVLAVVREEVARVLALSSADSVPPERPLRELGADSLMVVELRHALSRLAGARLPTTLAFDYPTAAAIARYLLDEVFGERPPAAQVVVTGEAPTATNELTLEDVAQLSDQEAFAIFDEAISTSDRRSMS